MYSVFRSTASIALYLGNGIVAFGSSVSAASPDPGVLRSVDGVAAGPNLFVGRGLTYDKS